MKKYYLFLVASLINCTLLSASHASPSLFQRMLYAISPNRELWDAIKAKDKEHAITLLQTNYDKIDFNYTRNGRPFLHLVARKIKDPGLLMDMLISETPYLRNQKDTTYLRLTPLHCAAAYNNPSAVLALLQKRYYNPSTHRYISDIKVNELDRDQNTPLHHAAFQISTPETGEMVQALLTEGAQVNAYSSFNATPLHLALNSYISCSSSKKNTAVITILLRAGADTDTIRNTNGRTCRQILNELFSHDQLQRMSDPSGALTKSARSKLAAPADDEQDVTQADI